MLKNIIPKNLVTCSPQTSLEEVASMMRREDVGAIVVIESSKRPVGVVTDRDIVVRCVSEGKDWNTTTAEDVMTESVETVDESESLFAAIKKMGAGEIRRIAVVDAKGQAVGIVSLGDILKFLPKELSSLAEGVAPEYDKIKEDAA